MKRNSKDGSTFQGLGPGNDENVKEKKIYLKDYDSDFELPSKQLNKKESHSKSNKTSPKSSLPQKPSKKYKN